MRAAPVRVGLILGAGAGRDARVLARDAPRFDDVAEERRLVHRVLIVKARALGAASSPSSGAGFWGAIVKRRIR